MKALEQIVRVKINEVDGEHFYSKQYTINLFYDFMRASIMMHRKKTRGGHLNVMIGVAVFSVDVGFGVW